MQRQEQHQSMDLSFKNFNQQSLFDKCLLLQDEQLSPLPATPDLSSPPITAQLMQPVSYPTPYKRGLGENDLVSPNSLPPTPSFQTIRISPPMTPFITKSNKDKNEGTPVATPSPKFSPPATPFIQPSLIRTVNTEKCDSNMNSDLPPTPDMSSPPLTTTFQISEQPKTQMSQTAINEAISSLPPTEFSLPVSPEFASPPKTTETIRIRPRMNQILDQDSCGTPLGAENLLKGSTPNMKSPPTTIKMTRVKTGDIQSKI